MSRSEDRPFRIVVVEDNAADIFLLEKALQSRNLIYQLDTYEDGERILKALSGGGGFVPDLILLDLNLPRSDGFQVLSAMRSEPSLVGVPVGILTSSEAASDRHRVQLTGSARYIHKPPTLDDFLQQVGDAILEMLPENGR